MRTTSKKTIKVVCNSNGKLITKEVEAKKFDEVIIDGKIFNLYIHRDILNHNRWMITEETSGFFLKGDLKNTVEARKIYDEYLKNTFIDFIKNKYKQYLMCVKRFNDILNNKNEDKQFIDSLEN